MSSKPIHHILIRPILTEKSVRMATAGSEGNGVTKYSFVVANKATKVEIAQAFETLYANEKVKVASVNTMHVRGKQRRVSVKRGRRASVGTTPSWKKAIVTLTADSPKVPMLEGV